jgi:nucleoid DNA-binding protein
MNKTDLVRFVTDQLDGRVSQRLAGEVVDAVFAGLSDGLINGDDSRGATVRINGFGTFQVRTQKPRISYGFNLTKGGGKPVHIEARKTVHFKASDLLRTELRNG